jgi:ABC-type transport system involved in cytochrome bd biosynthesis fused ATPase/permease subunit
VRKILEEKGHDVDTVIKKLRAHPKVDSWPLTSCYERDILHELLDAGLRKVNERRTQVSLMVEVSLIDGEPTIVLFVHQTETGEEIWALLERFFLLEKINQLPKKLDAILGDEVEFSGGQKQLISIIRTYLQARPVVVFDEGTNQLDAEHEGRVMDFLQELKLRSTILIITHKLTSARKADKIYVLDEGKIIEEGAHSQLLEKNGFYSRFWNLQVVD